VVSECNDECSECDEYDGGNKGHDLSMPPSVGSVSDVDVPPLTVIGIREMGQAKLEKLHKPRFVEAIIACMAYIDLLKSDRTPAAADDNSKLRSELRELKKAVFVNEADGDAYTQDTQDVLDGSNVGWDAINKLAEEQNPAPLTTVADTPLPRPRTGRTPLQSGRTAPGRTAPGRTTSRSLPSGSSRRGPRTCGACRPSRQ
jgi:hypothetical protein